MVVVCGGCMCVLWLCVVVMCGGCVGWLCVVVVCGGCVWRLCVVAVLCGAASCRVRGDHKQLWRQLLSLDPSIKTPDARFDQELPPARRVHPLPPTHHPDACQLNGEIEKGEEAIAELKMETEKYRGQDKGAASQRKRLIKELQDRSTECETKNAQFEDAHKALAGSIGQISRTIESLCAKLGCNTKMLVEMGTELGCNDSSIMVYLGLVEQRANELLSSYLQLQHHGHASSSTPYLHHGGDGLGSTPSGLLIGPNTPQVTAVPVWSSSFGCGQSLPSHPFTHGQWFL